MAPPSDSHLPHGAPQDRPGAAPPHLRGEGEGPYAHGRAQLPRGGGGGVRAVSHGLHGGVSHGDGPSHDAQESLNVQKCDKVSFDCGTDHL